ncbi:MAG: hypothetical protein JWO69_550, partial [Thermoleophilia bacterium]|nr:hypothetical protein [Thermoleophilia bacterium]
MTSINPRGATIGGGPTTAAAKQVSDPEEGQELVGADGIAVDRNPVLRTALLASGLGLAGAGAVALATTRLPKHALRGTVGNPRALLLGGIGAAAIGATLTAIGATKGADHVPYAARIDGTRTDALLRAAAFGHETGVVRIDDDSWGVVDLSDEDVDIDSDGPGSVRLGTPPVPFAGMVSKLGDAYVSDAGAWKNTGVPERTDLSRVSSKKAASLVGTSIGVTEAGSILRLGALREGGKVYSTRADAVRELFEAGKSNVAVAQLADGFVTFDIEGGPATRSSMAKGTRIEPFDHLDLLFPDGVGAFPKPGAAVDSTEMPMDDISARTIAEASELTGRRIGPDIARLGAVVASGTDPEAVRREVFEKDLGHTVLVHLADGYAAFSVPKEFDDFQTMLGPIDRLDMRPSGDLSGIPKDDISGRPVADAGSLVGRRIGTGPDGTARLGSVVATGATVADLGRQLFEQGHDHLVMVRLADGVAAFAPTGNFDSFRTLLGPESALTHQVGADRYDSSRSSTHVTTIDAKGLSLADADRLVGQRLGMDGGRIVRIAGIAERHATLDKAYGAAASTGRREYVVKLRDGAVRVTADGPLKSVRTGIDPYSSLHAVDGKYAFDTAGREWNFAGRSVPFEAREPLGLTLTAGGESGRADRHVRSYGSVSSAIESFARDMSGRRYAIVEADGRDGRAHVYELDDSGGSAWDERLGNVDGISEIERSRREFRREGGGVGNETVYDVVETHTWRVYSGDSGSRTIHDDGIDRTERVNPAAT